MAENPIVRKIGVEIECISPYFSPSQERALHTVAEIDGDGSIEMSDDDSNDDQQGVEVKTKPYSGERAEDAIRLVTTTLKEAGAHVNTTCGLHVHADAAPLAVHDMVKSYDGSVLPTGAELLYVHGNFLSHGNGWGRNDNITSLELLDILDDGGQLTPCVGRYGDGFLLEINGLRITNRRRYSPSDGRLVIAPTEQDNFYAYSFKRNDMSRVRIRMFEAMRFLAVVDPLLRAMIPASRRRNRYCLPFAKMVRSGGEMPTSIRAMYEGIVDRYCGINLNALRVHGTIENRYHNATIDPEKIIHWARMWARVVQIAISDRAGSEADQLNDVVSQKSRMDMFFALLDLPKATEKHLRNRVRAFSGADADAVKSYISDRKKNPVCVA